MAIEKLSKVTIFLPAQESRWFLSRLYQLNCIHIIDTSTQPDNSTTPDLQRFPTAGEGTEKNIQKLHTIFSLLKTFVQRKKGFIEGIFPIPLRVTQEEVDLALSSIHIDSVYRECQSIHEKYTNLQKRQKQLQEKINKFADFLPLSGELTRIEDVRNVSFTYCHVSLDKWNRLQKDFPVNDVLAWQIVLRSEHELKILFAYLKNDKEMALKIFIKFNVREIPFPILSGSAEDRIQELRVELSGVIQERDKYRQYFFDLSKKYRSLEILLGYWENERNKVQAQRMCALSKRVFILGGYIKVKDKGKLDALLQAEFSHASIFYEEPSPSDKVPVCITLSRFFKPAQLFINMFGLPNYFTFDPTPFVMISFLIFFGLCFGDVFYGLFLTVFSAWMIRRYKDAEALANFLKIFLYAGVSTIVFGALTGGWAGDLYSPVYLGENNILLKIKERLTLIDPLAKPVIALACAIGLGVLNQFYGIVLRMYGEIRKKNIMNAICDGFLWLIILPGFLILTSTIFFKMSGYVVSMGKYLTIIGAAGLIATQGRHEKGIFAKIFTGVVSLYGIVGTYGCTSFIGDILSYTRILALSLTTTIVGMSFNIVAVLFKTGTIIGTVFFVIALVTGHLFNFVMSILSAFIHPARLIFLEFFGRFYEGGAPKFQPYGFGNQRITVVEEDTK